MECLRYFLFKNVRCTLETPLDRSKRQNMYILHFIRIQTPNSKHFKIFDWSAHFSIIIILFNFFHFWPRNRSLFLCTPDHFTHVLRSAENRNSITNHTERMEKWKKCELINMKKKCHSQHSGDVHIRHAIHGKTVRKKKQLKPRFYLPPSKFIIIKIINVHSAQLHNHKSHKSRITIAIARFVAGWIR